MNGKNRSFPLAAFLMITLATFFIFALQQRKTNSIRLEMDENRALKMLPVIQEKTRPVNIAENFLRKQLKLMKPIDAESAAEFQHALELAFSKDFKLLVIDAEKNDLTSHGIDIGQHADFKAFLVDVFQYHTENRPDETRHTRKFLQRVFENSVSHGFIPNFINITQCRMNGQNGLLLAATLPTPDFPKSIRKIYSQMVPKTALPEQYHGSVMAFFPENSYSNIDFMQKHAGLTGDFNLDFYSISTFANTKKFIADKFSSELSDVFSTKLKTNYQAVFKSQNQIFGFTRGGLEISTAPDNDLIVVFALPPATRSIFADHLPVIIIFMANLGLLIFLFLRLKLTENQWDTGLQKKFVVLAVSACLLPVAGLLYQNNLQLELQKNAFERDVFYQLEKEIEKIETGHLLKRNDLAIMLQTLNAEIDPEKPVDKVLMEKEGEKLSKENVIQFYFANRDGSIESLDSRETWTSEDTRAGTTFVKALLRFIIENLKLDFARVNTGAGKINKEEMLIETVSEAMGVETIYQLAINQKQFLPFKLSHGSVWSYLELQNDYAGKPARLIMHVVNRNSFTQDFVDKLQKAQPQNEPTIIFMNRSMMQIEKIAPTIAELKPEMIDILKTANSSGGCMQLRLENGNETTLIVARQLKEMNWSCLTLKKLDKSMLGGIGSNALLLSASILSYLFIIIAFLADWLRKFFLKPLLELNRSALEISAGNYEIQPGYKGNDELGFLFTNFAEMAKELKEKEFLSRFLSDIARDAITGQKGTRATRIDATVLFSDIRSFTTLSETYPPEEIGIMLNDYMTLMEGIIEKHGGNIEKFIGDAIMALFLPRMGMAHPALRATLAAQEMTEALKGFNIQREKNGKFRVSNGFGIAHGELLMGTMGNLEGRRDFTVTGKTVNIAAEMEKASKLTQKFPIVLCPVSAQIAGKNGMTSLRIAHEREAYEII